MKNPTIKQIMSAMESGKTITVRTGGVIGRTRANRKQKFPVEKFTGQIMSVHRHDRWLGDKIVGRYWWLTIYIPSGLVDDFRVVEKLYTEPRLATRV